MHPLPLLIPPLIPAVEGHLTHLGEAPLILNLEEALTLNLGEVPLTLREARLTPILEEFPLIRPLLEAPLTLLHAVDILRLVECPYILLAVRLTQVPVLLRTPRRRGRTEDLAVPEVVLLMHPDNPTPAMHMVQVLLLLKRYVDAQPDN